MSSPTEATTTPGTVTVKQRHPRGIYTLFFTEMWERFSYYGMRALLILFMSKAIQEGAMGMTEKVASAIYGLYTAAVYLAALPGGWVADRLFGAQRTVFAGGCIIALGHFSMAIPRSETFFVGLILIVVGTGLLKPNISAIVGGLYPEGGARRDAGFTIFYMGINVGAAIGPLLCGYLGERVNWHYGFGAAGVGMVLGLIQYALTRRHLGEAGLRPGHPEGAQPKHKLILAGIGGVLTVIILLLLTGRLQVGGVTFAQPDVSRPLAMTEQLKAQADPLSAYLWQQMEPAYQEVVRTNRTEEARRLAITAVLVNQLNNVLTNAGFYTEQRFAHITLSDESRRRLEAFHETFHANSPQPDAKAPQKTSGQGKTSNVEAEAMAAEAQAAALARLNRSLLQDAFPEYLPRRWRLNPIHLAAGTTYLICAVAVIYFAAILVFYPLDSTERKRVGVIAILFLGAAMFWSGFEQAGSSLNLFADQHTDRVFEWTQKLFGLEQPWIMPASWFQMLNPIYIIVLAPVAASTWVTLARYGWNPSLPVKFALGLLLLAAGFLVMAAAASLAANHQVWPTWLIITYLLHSIGELCLSPVGLSSVTKLSPQRLVGQMMGTWFLAASLGNLVAGLVAGEVSGGTIEEMPARYLHIVYFACSVGLLFLIFAKPIRKMTGGIQ